MSISAIYDTVLKMHNSVSAFDTNPLLKHLFLEKNKSIFFSLEENILGYLQMYFDRNWAKNNSSTELQCCWSMYRPMADNGLRPLTILYDKNLAQKYIL